MKTLHHVNRILAFASFALFIILSSCSAQRKISKEAKTLLIKDKDFSSAHIGICIYDPSTNKYLYNYNADKYFIPASNTKILTCYAAMKYLGDSLITARVAEEGNRVFLIPNGDPTLLHDSFPNNHLLDYLKNLHGEKTIIINDNNFQDRIYGEGWSWDDYMEDYMQERSAFPIYYNTAQFSGTKDHFTVHPALRGIFEKDSIYPADAYLGEVTRDLASNNFQLLFNTKKDTTISVPFCTNKGETNVSLLQQLIKAKIILVHTAPDADAVHKYMAIKSQPVDSMLKMMMHRSDNFFAEQSLLMVSNEKLGVMNDEMIIQTLLESDLKDMPQKPRWVDGSGLSRFNLFTPEDFVFALNKIKNEFDWNRITTIFPTPGSGTLTAYAQNSSGRIYAKTGTLSNNAALSGYAITKKGKTLIFSFLISNHMSSASKFRNKAIQIMNDVINRY